MQWEGVFVEVAKGEIWKTHKGVVIGPAELVKAWVSAHAENLREVTPMKLSSAWTALTKAALIAFGTSAVQAQGLQVTGSVSGNFLNTWTNIVEYHTIEFVSDLSLSDYSVLEPLDDETYEVTVQVTDPEAQLLRLSLLLTDGQVVSVTSETPTNQLTLTYRGNWLKIFRPIAEALEWLGKIAIEVLKTTGAQELAEYLQEFLRGKKKGTMKIQTRIFDSEQGTISPFGGTLVEVWRGDKRVWPPPKANFIVQTDANGEVSIPLLPKAPDYLVRALKKNVSIPACPEVWDGPYAVNENQTTNAVLDFYYHKSIRGKVEVSGGPVVGHAKASLWKGDQKLTADYETDSNWIFTIPPMEIDGLASGTYTLRVDTPPPASMHTISPPYHTKDVTLTKCERTKPGVDCPRRTTINAGTFQFTVEPAGGMGG